ncbi:alkaline phosphatase D family protein [Microbacterium sp. ARD31]|uniref:alkaline phosphatase D family protein n=1 Tax=Microbacterium sp. ARD31 TaxID=2962576 RepID=UPI00288186A2|nr:alkaline phosphatase D family protein [Microbacterium sp. ARD31]MDT0180496.1 alkaline phosphatase D family protein [Microbacterium sp. ARD31]
MASSPLVLGPMLRYTDETSAAVWVETATDAQVSVHADGRVWRTRTFAVHGHHYALVELDELTPGAVLPYEVRVGGTLVWPEADAPLPAPVIATPAPERRLRMAWGSCRTSVDHDAAGNRRHGVDAMRTFALALGEDSSLRPDLILLLGDQVYADVTTQPMQDFIAQRRDIEQPPGEELKDYEEYAHLYRLAWSDDANRWLLSTVPSAMIFDDHDVRDDWNASLDWKKQMEATSWWHGRIVAGLASYWVYQHLGNLSPAERAEDEIWQRVLAHTGPDELDLSTVLDDFADRVDREPTTYRFSYRRDFGDIRLVVVDSRAARDLTPTARALVDATEWAWLDAQLQGGVRHLLVATSLPYLLPIGLHHVESWDEAISQGAWGRRAARVGERLRQMVDLEHWAAWQNSFQALARVITEIADGGRGTAPDTLLFLSGDVHFSYIAEVDRSRGSRIVQAVCSPVRNPLPRVMRWFSVVMSYGVARPIGALVARSAKVPDPPFEWSTVKGPWFDNNLSVLQDTPGGLQLTWHTGVVEDGEERHPRIDEVSRIVVGPRTAVGSRTSAR